MINPASKASQSSTAYVNSTAVTPRSMEPVFHSSNKSKVCMPNVMRKYRPTAKYLYKIQASLALVLDSGRIAEVLIFTRPSFAKSCSIINIIRGQWCCKKRGNSSGSKLVVQTAHSRNTYNLSFYLIKDINVWLTCYRFCSHSCHTLDSQINII